MMVSPGTVQLASSVNATIINQVICLFRHFSFLFFFTLASTCPRYFATSRVETRAKPSCYWWVSLFNGWLEQVLYTSYLGHSTTTTYFHLLWGTINWEKTFKYNAPILNRLLMSILFNPRPFFPSSRLSLFSSSKMGYIVNCPDCTDKIGSSPWRRHAFLEELHTRLKKKNRSLPSGIKMKIEKITEKEDR